MRVLSELRDRVRAVELEHEAERGRTGRRVLGRRAVLAKSWRITRSPIGDMHPPWTRSTWTYSDVEVGEIATESAMMPRQESRKAVPW